MQTRQFIVDTDDATLHVDGTINLENEQLDLTLRPDSKGVRIFSLRSPLYVKGTFSDPDVSVDKGVLALRAGGALALAAVAPFAALLPLVNAGPGEQSECAALLNQAGRKPVAPPPGKQRARPAARPQDGRAGHATLRAQDVAFTFVTPLCALPNRSYCLAILFCHCACNSDWRTNRPLPCRRHGTESKGDLPCKRLKNSPLPLPSPHWC